MKFRTSICYNREKGYGRIQPSGKSRQTCRLVGIGTIVGIGLGREAAHAINVLYCCSTGGSSEVPRNPLTRWDVSSIPANGIFLTKKLKNKIKMPNGWRTIKSLVHKIRLHGRRGKGMAESFSREKLRHAPQKEGG